MLILEKFVVASNLLFDMAGLTIIATTYKKVIATRMQRFV